ncbi:MAG: response regulator [Chloroflexota bacterium]
MKTILVVDDSHTTQHLVRRVLQHEGYNVRIASNGHSALACLAEHQPDLLIADLRMPEMDGIALIRTLRSTPCYAQMPIIVLTASPLQRDYTVVQELSVDAFLTKPASSQQLITTIHRILSKLTPTSV